MKKAVYPKLNLPPQGIETIIHSFERFALGDLKFIQSKPIAAFLLAVCFIDQLSAFRYSANIEKKDRPEFFINDYMHEYSGLGLYNYVRHCLVHFYSSEGRFGLTNENFKNVPYMSIGTKININTDVFITSLEKAFAEVCKDFRIVNSEAYINARKRSQSHPVIVGKDN